MKKFIYTIATILLIGISSAVFAQSSFNYQGIARNAAGVAIANQNLGIRISILEGSAAGPVVYQETQTGTTNALGLFNLNIGEGTPVSGVFQDINWLSDAKFIQIEMDPAGGTSYTDLGAKKLNHVPFASLADNANGVLIYGSGTANPFKMVVSHSPQFPEWGIGYNDIDDAVMFTSDDGVTPGVSISLLGKTISIPGGNPGVDKVLRSDATGNASWEDFSTKVSAIAPTGCQHLATITTSFQKITDLGTFVKSNSASMIELDYQTNFMVTFTAVGGGVIYQLRVDNAGPTVGQAGLLLRDDQSDVSVPGSIHGIYGSLASGTHTVSIWVKKVNATASNAYIDPGCFNSYNTNTIIVKEFR